MANITTQDRVRLAFSFFHNLEATNTNNNNRQPPPNIAATSFRKFSNGICSICEQNTEVTTYKFCKHQADVCMECLLSWTIHRIKDHNTISCYNRECRNTRITFENVRKFLTIPNDVVNVYQTRTRRALNTMKDVTNCAVFTCNGFNVHNARMRFKCNECGLVTCVKHGIATTETGQFCCELDYGDSDETIKKIAKRCPHCKVPIQKNEGCNHMTCKLCTGQFCYSCGEAYVAGHFDGARCKQFEN